MGFLRHKYINKLQGYHFKEHPLHSPGESHKHYIVSNVLTDNLLRDTICFLFLFFFSVLILVHNTKTERPLEVWGENSESLDSVGTATNGATHKPVEGKKEGLIPLGDAEMENTEQMTFLLLLNVSTHGSRCQLPPTHSVSPMFLMPLSEKSGTETEKCNSEVISPLQG